MLLLLNEPGLIEHYFRVGHFNVLENSGHVRSFHRVKSIRYQTFKVRREVSRDEIDLASKFHVLFVEIVTVESF